MLINNISTDVYVVPINIWVRLFLTAAHSGETTPACFLMLWASPVRHTCCWRAVKNLWIIKTISLSGLCVTNTPVQVLIIKLSISSGVTGRVSSLWQLSDGVVRGIAVVWSSCQQKVSVRVWRHSPVSLLMRFRKLSIWTDSYTAQDRTTDLPISRGPAPPPELQPTQTFQLQSA